MDESVAEDKISETMRSFRSFVPSNVFSIFDLVEDAEKMIESAILKNPKDAPVLWDTFKVIRPRQFLIEYAKRQPKVYETHVKELLQRALNGEDFVPATDAEILVTLSKVSMNAPMHNNPAFIMMKIFREIFPKDYERFGFNELDFSENYRGASDELMVELRHKVRDEERKHTPDLTKWDRVWPDKKAAILGGYS